MKAGWQLKPLAELCEFVATGPFGSLLGVKDYTEAGVPVVNPADIDGNRISSQTAKTVSEATAQRLSQYRMKNGDIVIARRGELGRCAVVKDDETGFICGTGSFFARPSSHIFPHYLALFIASPVSRERLVAASTGATMPNLSNTTISVLPIPLPSLDEQKRIVAVLDEAFEDLDRARAHAEANLADARELFISHLRLSFLQTTSCFTARRVSEVAEHCLGKMLDKNKNQGIPRPYLRNINVRWFSIDTDDMLEMKIEDREVERYSAKQGDLLICEGGYPGRSAIWDQDDTVFFQKALHRVRFTNPAYAKLLMYYLFLQDATGQLKEHFTGSGIQHFTGQALGRFSMPFPELSVTKGMVSKIEEVHSDVLSLEAAYQKTAFHLDALRQSLLQKAFSGELT